VLCLGSCKTSCEVLRQPHKYANVAQRMNSGAEDEDYIRRAHDKYRVEYKLDDEDVEEVHVVQLMGQYIMKKKVSASSFSLTSSASGSDEAFARLLVNKFTNPTSSFMKTKKTNTIPFLRSRGMK
ncbi:hypothetical protein Tco_1349893, partial [Tanacetum coccineum]